MDVSSSPDLNNFSSMISSTLSLFNVEFQIFGFTMCMWDVFIWTSIASIIFYILREGFFNGGS